MCWSVLQCAAVCCSVLQCFAVCCSVLQYVAVCCSVLQCVAVCCSVLRVLQCVAVCCSVLQYVAVCNRCSPHKHITSQVYILGVAMSCSVLQCAAVRCSALQCVSDTVSTCVQIFSVVQSVAVCCSVSYCVWDAMSTCVLHLRFASEWVGLFYRSLSCRSPVAEEMRDNSYDSEIRLSWNNKMSPKRVPTAFRSLFWLFCFQWPISCAIETNDIHPTSRCFESLNSRAPPWMLFDWANFVWHGISGLRELQILVALFGDIGLFGGDTELLYRSKGLI